MNCCQIMVAETTAKRYSRPWWNPYRSERSHDAVRQSVERLRDERVTYSSLRPKGPDGRTEGWRSGFYHIAYNAQVPVAPVYFDYQRWECRIGPATVLSGDREVDLDILRFYAGVRRGIRSGHSKAPGRDRDQVAPMATSRERQRPC
jgi:hypothetical protein